MIREAEQKDLDELLKLYLFLHEDSIPENNEHLRNTWTRILQDSNHHLIVNEIDGRPDSECPAVCLCRKRGNTRSLQRKRICRRMSALRQADCGKRKLLQDDAADRFEEAGDACVLRKSGIQQQR